MCCCNSLRRRCSARPAPHRRVASRSSRAVRRSASSPRLRAARSRRPSGLEWPCEVRAVSGRSRRRSRAACPSPSRTASSPLSWLSRRLARSVRRASGIARSASNSLLRRFDRQPSARAQCSVSGVVGLASRRSLSSARPTRVAGHARAGAGGEQGLVDQVALRMAAAEALRLRARRRRARRSRRRNAPRGEGEQAAHQRQADLARHLAVARRASLRRIARAAQRATRLRRRAMSPLPISASSACRSLKA